MTNKKLIRVYQVEEVKEIKKQLLIYGDLSGQCANCDQMDINLEATCCPQCKAVFQYVSFRNIKSHIPKVYRMLEERPEVIFIDFDDYKRNLGAVKAEEFLK